MADSEVSNPPVRIGMKLPNVLFLTRPLREFLRLTLEAESYDEEFIYDFGMAVSELVNNSFEHASERERHEVEIDLEVAAERVVFRIRDEGQGRLVQSDFEAQSGGPPDHLEDRGRGLFLISCFTDEVKVREIPGGGTEVEITKRRGGQE